ncbi:MAG: GTP cyclohydrolase I FolE2 [Polyangiaceae bacterium]|nr:GTP cyclohydrolase I FolE2 [Polyangiaceae bacterium]
MEDLQSHQDERGVPLDEVGVSGLRYPIRVWDQARERQATVATFEMSVALPQEFKGTHMSRFIEVLEARRGEISLGTLPQLVEELATRLSAPSARVLVKFPYFLERAAPVSGAVALMDYECAFEGRVVTGELGKVADFTLEVTVPVTSLCPCSKAISDYGAHNQRSALSMRVQSVDLSPASMIWIEELVALAERSASAPVYPLLKRADERHVTMQAYDNPVFVEDMVRNVAVQLKEDPRVAWFEVRADNHESIHNHAAFARTSWRREPSG